VKFTARPRDEGQKAFFMKVKMNRWTCGRRRSDLRRPEAGACGGGHAGCV